MSLTPFAAVLVGLLAGTPPRADDGWPCEAPAAPLAAPATYWPDLARPVPASRATDATVGALAQGASSRSIDEADAVAQVRRFATSHPDRDDRSRLAAALIAAVDGERRVIVDGIRRFNQRQAQLATRIEQAYAALDAADTAPTAERRGALTEQVEWDQRIFEERQRMLPIICRQPGALEGRLTALLAALK